MLAMALLILMWCTDVFTLGIRITVTVFAAVHLVYKIGKLIYMIADAMNEAD